MSSRVADAQNQIKRWERRYPLPVVKLFVLDHLQDSHSPRNKSIYQNWIETHRDVVKASPFVLGSNPQWSSGATEEVEQ